MRAHMLTVSIDDPTALPLIVLLSFLPPPGLHMDLVVTMAKALAEGTEVVYLSAAPLPDRMQGGRLPCSSPGRSPLRDTKENKRSRCLKNCTAPKIDRSKLWRMFKSRTNGF